VNWADVALRTGLWFCLGALIATLAIGVAAAFALGGRHDGLPAATLLRNALSGLTT
jgi:hypothetical protein